MYIVTQADSASSGGLMLAGTSLVLYLLTIYTKHHAITPPLQSSPTCMQYITHTYTHISTKGRQLLKYRPTLFHRLYLCTGLADWIHGLSWKQILNNNPGIIHLLQHWRHHYRATTADTALPYKSYDTSACTN